MESFNQGKGFKWVAEEVLVWNIFCDGKWVQQSSYENLMKSPKIQQMLISKVKDSGNCRPTKQQEEE